MDIEFRIYNIKNGWVLYTAEKNILKDKSEDIYFENIEELCKYLKEHYNGS